MNTPGMTHSLSPSQGLQLSPGREALTFPSGNSLIKPATGKAGKTGGREEEEEGGARKKKGYKQNYPVLEVKGVTS